MKEKDAEASYHTKPKPDRYNGEGGKNTARENCGKEITMACYSLQTAYTPLGWAAALVKDPRDRLEAVKPVVERLGGKSCTAGSCSENTICR